MMPLMTFFRYSAVTVYIHREFPDDHELSKELSIYLLFYPPEFISTFQRRNCFLLCNALEKQLVKTISERSILAGLNPKFRPLREPCQFCFVVKKKILKTNKVTTAQCCTCHWPFSTIITVSPVLLVERRVDVVISVLMAGFLRSCGVELLRVFDAVVDLTPAIFPGSLQSKLLFEQSVEKGEELFQFIGTAA